MDLADIPVGEGYSVITHDPGTGQTFDERMLKSWQHGAPLGVVVHRQGNPIHDTRAGGATALNSIRWGIREGAFSIHYYVEGGTVYRCVDEARHAFHVLEFRVAQERGRPIYRDSFMAKVPQWLTAKPKGQFAGASKPRGDIGMLGIECVDRQRADGSVYFDQATRRSLVLLVRDILVRNARLRGTWLADTMSFSITGHQTWDQWTRPDDPGQALYLPDFTADVLDLATGREPWRTVGPEYDGRTPVRDRAAADIDADEIQQVVSFVQQAQERLGQAAARLERIA